MSNIKRHDNLGQFTYMKASGSGTESDPHIQSVQIESSASSESSLQANGTATSSGDTTILAAPPAGSRHKLNGLKLQNNTDSEVTVIVKFGASSYDTYVFTIKGSGVVRDYSKPVPLPNGTSVVLNLSAASSVFWQLLYETEIN